MRPQERSSKVAQAPAVDIGRVLCCCVERNASLDQNGNMLDGASDLPGCVVCPYGVKHGKRSCSTSFHHRLALSNMGWQRYVGNINR
jgi:hypothetical protein